jgi:peptidyl-prolyl cis-trans isomerase SurA
MKKTICFSVLICFFAQISFAQELFRFGNNKVMRDEFMRNYNRNNPQNNTDRTASLKENLELYIRYKLKVQAAYDLKYDTLPNQREELFSFRRQVESNYLKEDKAFSAMVNQAFDRMQKDLRVSHILVMFTDASKKTDTLRAQKKVAEIMNRLKAGEDFSKVALAFSEDPSVTENKGDLGYITVFSLPYEMENVIYATTTGKYSAPYKSSFAYHIFKNAGERKAMGKMKASQILIAFPPNVTESQKQVSAEQAENLYNRLQKGEPFDNIARAFSNDYVSAQSGGVMPDFGTGKFEPIFENAIYNLAKDGDISRPFVTAYGYHIVKRNGREPVGTVRDDPGVVQQISEQIKNDSRNEKVKDVFVKSILSRTGYREAPVNKTKLLALTENMLAEKPYPDNNITEKSTLHSFKKLTVKVGDFWRFAREARGNNQFRDKNTEGLLKEYVKATALEYYRDRLEEYDAAFKNQLMEFKDGNLLFEAMEKNVWNKSAQDTLGLSNHYKENKQKYLWDASADAIVFTAPDKATAEQLSLKIKSNPGNWRDSVLLYADNVQADSSRYLFTDLPVPENTRFENGKLTPPVAAGNESATVFTYIVKTYTAGAQRSFEEARGFVINDYQHLLEERWIAQLKKKYPVTVNQPVWQQILQGKK